MEDKDKLEDNILSMIKANKRASTKRNMDIISMEKQLIDERNAALKSHFHSHTIRKIAYHKKLYKWLKLIEERLFTPEKLDKMLPDQLANLLKTVSHGLTESFKDIDRLESVIKEFDAFTQAASKISDIATEPREKMDAVKALKNLMFKIAQTMPNDNGDVIDAEVTPSMPSDRNE